MARRSTWQEHVRRGTTLGITVSFHLLVLNLTLRPAMDPQNTKSDRPDAQRLQLRLFRPQATASTHMTAIGHRTTATSTHSRLEQTELSSKPATIKQVPAQIPVIARPFATEAAVVPAGNPKVGEDGGFHQRILQSQQSSVTSGIPGSDVSRVPGIRLTDPDTQGVGAVARKVQRLFGIPSRACIDIEAWRNLPPRQLSERHLSSSELDHLDEKNHCNEPMGLAF